MITGSKVYEQKDTLLSQLNTGFRSKEKQALIDKVNDIEIPSMAGLDGVDDAEIKEAAQSLRQCQIDNLTRCLEKGSNASPETVVNNPTDTYFHGIV